MCKRLIYSGIEFDKQVRLIKRLSMNACFAACRTDRTHHPLQKHRPTDKGCAVLKEMKKE
jgi:hypothetical protein